MQNHWQNQGRQLVSVASFNPRLDVFVGVGEKVRLFPFRDQSLFMYTGGWRKIGGAKAILNEQRGGGAIVFFWYKDKGESYDSARFMRRYI